MTRTIERVLIANRGEIAVRIARTLHDLGLHSIAVYSDADRHAAHVAACDEAVYIGGSAPADSYLRQDRILAAARATVAHAIHPGFGFLSENADFARAVDAAGFIFIGPTAASIDAMGSKKNAKELAKAAGVPVIPGEVADLQQLSDQADRIGYPVLLKASAGGGGKGMAIVRQPSELTDAAAAAQRTALAAFGDDTLLIEKYIDAPRHVEIQILGDSHGEVVHLFERECSIQRRYQKILEESPSPALTPELRQRMGSSAAALGRSIGYVGAGTVEFIVDARGDFYFLEVNTRLQVEHPVTEAVTGLDLVELQIRVAMGEPLPDTVLQARQNGWAIEARLYAEDPAAGYLPDSGRLLGWSVNPGPGVRVDTGVRQSDEVTSWYDPMIAKVIAWGPTREVARLRLRRALSTASIAGVRTNRDLLLRILGHDAFTRGALHTHFLDEFPQLAAGGGELDTQSIHAAILQQALLERSVFDSLPSVHPAFRLFGTTWVRDTLVADQRELAVAYSWIGPDALVVEVDGQRTEVALRAASEHGRQLRWESGGQVHTADVWVTPDVIWVNHDNAAARLLRKSRFPDSSAAEGADGHRAPMTGRVVAVRVEVGQSVVKGEPLVIMDAMKMEHTITALWDGEVERIAASTGEQVEAGAILVVVTRP
jgi:acetyl-CoA carboxylase biotin carboxylase subunit